MRRLAACAALLLLSVSVVGLPSCGSGGEELPSAGDGPQGQTGLVEGPEYDFGVIESSDNDGDGTADAYVLSFEREEVADDLFLERTVGYTKQDDGLFVGEIVLHFENEGAGTASHTHVEYIPKEFAASVDDLVFSVPPSEILDPDPECAWKLGPAGPGEVLPDWEGGKVDIRVTSSTPTTPDAAEDSLVAYTLEEGGRKCESMGGEAAKLCALELLRGYRDTEEVQESAGELSRRDAGEAIMLAVIKRDLDECSLLSPEAGALCRRLAFQTLLRDCEQVATATGRSDCVRGYLYAISDEERGGVCQCLADEALRDECLGTADPSVCEDIADPGLRAQCLAYIAATEGDASICESIEGAAERNGCLRRIAEATKDAGLCDDITDPEARDYCRSQVAVAAGDLSLCDDIGDAHLRNGCIATIVYQSESITDAGICDKIVPEFLASLDEYDTFPRDLCLLAVISRTKDPSLCEKMGDESTRDICRLAFAARQGNVSRCYALDDPTAQCVCVAMVAVSTGDASLCAKITNAGAAGQCVKAVNGEGSGELLVGGCYECSQSCVEGAVTATPKPTTQEPSPTPVPTAGPSLPDIAAGCDVTPPPGSQHHTEGKYDYWTMPNSSTKVGPYWQWFDDAKTQPYVYRCYDTDGKAHGSWVTWYRGGTQWEKVYNYDHGELEGPFMRWYENGQLRDVGTYLDGELDGAYQSYYDDGCPLCTSDYDRGDLVSEECKSHWSCS